MSAPAAIVAAGHVEPCPVSAGGHRPPRLGRTGLPPRCCLDHSAVDFSRLRRSDTVTECPYKGRTSETWSVAPGEQIHPDLAWSSAFPTLALQPIAGLVAFDDEQVDIVEQPRRITHLSRR